MLSPAQNRQLNYTILAFAIAPLSSALILGSLLFKSTDPSDWFGNVAFFYFWSCVIGIPLGLPLFLLCRALDLVRWWSASVAGLVVGGVPGVIAGFTFWSIWRLGAPKPATQPGALA